jgi:hypothetical protein
MGALSARNRSVPTVVAGNRQPVLINETQHASLVDPYR